MKAIITALTILYLQSLSFAQETKTDISAIKNIKEAEEFIKSHPNTGAKIFQIGFGTEVHDFISQILNKKPGYTFSIDNYTYKLLSFDSVLCNRVRYIYLDGSQISKTEIDRLRKEIIAKYRSGTDFGDLVTLYNMDGNTTGDTGWFGDNVMTKEFETAIKAHKKDDIFTIDTPSANWYHVVLKTNNPAYQLNFSILKIKSQ